MTTDRRRTRSRNEAEDSVPDPARCGLTGGGGIAGSAGPMTVDLGSSAHRAEVHTVPRLEVASAEVPVHRGFLVAHPDRCSRSRQSGEMAVAGPLRSADRQA